MSNIYYTKFVKFLEKHNLYDKTFFEFFWKNSVFIDLLDDDFSYLIGGTIIVLDTKNKLKEFTIEYSGTGDTVVSMSPDAGSSIPINSTVRLMLD